MSTIVGGLVNLVLLLALMFWPSGDYEVRLRRDAWRSRQKAAHKTGAASVAAARIARATGAEFGRAF